MSAVIGGPNCRTTSVLRSYEGGPPQARAWGNGEEWGKADASTEDLKKVHDDDEMMFKMILLYLVAKYTRKVELWGESKASHFLLEQPDSPDYKPEVVSFWWTSEWSALQKAEGLQLMKIQQGDYGGQYVKPTGLGTDLNVRKGISTQKAGWKECWTMSRHEAASPLDTWAMPRDCEGADGGVWRRDQASQDELEGTCGLGAHPVQAGLPHMSGGGCKGPSASASTSPARWMSLRRHYRSSMSLPGSTRRKEIYAHSTLYMGEEEG